MGTGRRLTILVTSLALVLGLVGSIATARAAGPSQGADILALQSSECPAGFTFVAKVELGTGGNPQRGFEVGETVTLTTTDGGTVTIQVTAVNGEGEILGFTVTGASFSLVGVIVVAKFGNDVVQGGTSPNGNGLSNFVLCAAIAVSTSTPTVPVLDETETPVVKTTATATATAPTSVETETPVSNTATTAPATTAPATKAPTSGAPTLPNTGAGAEGGLGIQSSQMALLMLLLLGAMAAIGGLVRQTRQSRG